MACSTVAKEVNDRDLAAVADLLGEHVDLDVDERARADGAEVGALERLGDERDHEAMLAQRAYREADPVEGDGALLDQIALQRGVVAFDLEYARETLLADGEHCRGAVDVALHDVAAESVVGTQRQLEVDGRALAEEPQG